MRISESTRKFFPYTIKYLEKYGEQKLPPPQNWPRKFKEDQNPENFYKYLLENNLRWEDVCSGKDYV